MDRELWKIVLEAIKQAARVVASQNKHRRRPIFADWLIVAMYLWCVWHDRPLCWACDRYHYGRLFRPRKLPSVSQFTRRIKTDACQQILQLTHDALAQRGLLTQEGYIDGKPLLVSPVSKDSEATRGRICGGFGKGYKLHAYVNEHGRIVTWSVTGLHEDEKTVARVLLPYLPPMSETSVILADSNYDAAPLHKAAGDAVPQTRLVTPLRGQNRVGKQGHHPVTLRQMGPTRRELLATTNQTPHLVRYVLKSRIEIERRFGVLTCTGGGLGTALPSWVRTQNRVTRWVGAKIILYNARLKARANQSRKAAA